jgi:hypothetical protein
MSRPINSFTCFSNFSRIVSPAAVHTNEVLLTFQASMRGSIGTPAEVAARPQRRELAIERGQHLVDDSADASLECGH